MGFINYVSGLFNSQIQSSIREILKQVNVLKRDFKGKIAVAFLVSVVLSLVIIWRMCWAHPDIQAYTSLQYMEDINSLLRHRYSDVSWYVLGSGHSMNLYMWFQYVEALFFNFDSRLEIPVMTIAHSILTLSLLVSLRGLIVQQNTKIQMLIIALVPISMFSFLGMGSRGMELGTFLGIAITFFVWAVSTTSKLSRISWFGILFLQVFTVFTALGGYSMGVSGAALLVCLIFYYQEAKISNGKIAACRNLIKTRFVQFSIVLSISSLAHILAVKIFSTPSSNISQMSSFYSVTGLLKAVVNGNAQPLLNVSVNERWGSNWTQVDTSHLGILMTALYLFLTTVYLRKGSAWANYLVGMLWYGTFVSLTVYPFRPYGTNWMSNPWYSFHYKVSLAAAIIGIICLISGRVNLSVLRMFKALLLLLIGLVFLQANVIMWQRHPHERSYFLGKRDAALNTELLSLDSSGLTQLGLDMQSTLRAIEIQREHRLSVFGGVEKRRNEAIVLGMTSDGWMLQTMEINLKASRSCRLIIDVTSMAGVEEGGETSIVVIGGVTSSSEKFYVKPDELPLRIEIVLNESSTVNFENVMSAPERGSDIRALSARGYVSCIYTE